MMIVWWIWMWVHRKWRRWSTVPVIAPEVAMPKHEAAPPTPTFDGELPKVGDEVLFHSDGRWRPAQVLAIKDNGELALLYDQEEELIHQRATHGPQLFGWLTYEEAASGTIVQANA
jgi:hypothetical protein